MSKAALIATPEGIIKGVNSQIYGFIWRGNDKIKRSAISGRLFKTSFYKEWVGNLTSLVTLIFVNFRFVFQFFIRNIFTHEFLFSFLFSLGVVKIRDLVSETGNFRQSLNILQANLSPVQCFKLMRCNSSRLETSHHAESATFCPTNTKRYHPFQSRRKRS